ncbi:MAG: hypothetical protein EBR82_14365 [Caulobacteraceae bacterium]|nr:hypothetical protein [Caulobacteraceae bacterium]
MKGMLTSPLDRATERSKLENEAALSQQQQDKANDYNKYNKAKTSFQQQELAFEQMNTGGRQAGHEVELSRMRRDNALALAELRANAEFSAGNYKDAVETIDKKVQLMFDDQKQAVDNNFRWLEANQNDLTDSEAKQIDTVNRQKEEQIKEKMDATKVVSKILMENNAPAEIRAALTKVAQDPKSSVSDIYGAAGKYGVDAYKQAQINSLNAAAEKARRVDTSGGMGGVGGAYTNDLDAMMGLVKSTIPTKFGQQTFQNQLNKARNDGDRISLMAGQVLKSYPAEIKRDFVNQVSGLAMIDKAIAEVDNDAKTGVINNALQYTYNVFGKDYDPKLQKINSYITSAIQPYRNSVTGAAWSEQEDSEYANLFGSTKYSPVELRQRLVQVREMLKSKSAQGLNAYTNPLGYYDNPYQSGQFAPGEGTPSGQTQIPFAPGQSGGSSDDALLSNYGL